MDSLEVRSIIAFIEQKGVPFRVTATGGTYVSPANPCSPHSPGSYHCRTGTGGVGLAVDLAEPTASHDTPGLLRIWAQFGVAESSLAEGIYYDAPYAIHNGKRVNGFAIYGRTVMEQHRNHVHIAVNKGTMLMPLPPNGSAQGGGLMPDYEMQGSVVAFVPTPSGNGYYVVTDAGEIFGFGDAKYFGRTHKKP